MQKLGSQRLTRSSPCTVVSVALTQRSLSVAAGFLDGSVVARVVLSGCGGEEEEEEQCGRWRPFTDEAVGCLSIEAGSLAAVEREAAQRGPAGVRQGLLVGLGTEGGHAALADLPAVACALGWLPPRTAWLAHPSTGCLETTGVRALAVAGDVVLTGGADSDACLWRQDSAPQRSRPMRGAHGGAVTAAAAAAANAPSSPATAGSHGEQWQWQAATGGEDGVVRVWAATTQEPAELRARKAGASAPSTVTHLVLDGPHQRLGAGHSDGTARIWDLNTGSATRRLRHVPPSSSRSEWRRGGLVVAFDTDAHPSHFATGGADGSWSLWDLRLPEKQPVIHRFRPYGEAIGALAVAGHRLLSACIDGRAELSDLRHVPENEADSVGVQSRLWAANLHQDVKDKFKGCDAGVFNGEFLFLPREAGLQPYNDDDEVRPVREYERPDATRSDFRNFILSEEGDEIRSSRTRRWSE